jgi:hypothetical protein
MSECVTWELCPSCQEQAAVGWTGDEVVEFDCVGGCSLTEDQMVELRQRCSLPTGDSVGTQAPPSSGA